MLEKIFKLKELNTNIKTEIIAGLTTFMTMAYIIFVNPAILQEAGLPFHATVAATCAVAALMTILMGVVTNYPFALAPGMGLNAFLTYSVCKGMGLSWQTAMAIIFLEGLIITILVLTKLREAIMKAIPISLKQAIGVGIGLFIAFIGFKEAGLISGNPATLVTMGNISSETTLLSLFGLIVTIILIALRVKGSLLIGIIITTVASIPFGLSKMPSSILCLPSFETFGGFVFGLREAVNIGMWAVIFSFLISDFFDTMGTVIAVGQEGKFLVKGYLPGINKVLLIDSLAAMFGGIFSASSATTYIESAAGVASGGRTGLTSVVVGILFIFALFFSPVVGIVPEPAVAPALIVVGFLMMTVVKEIPWHEFDEAFPAFLIMLLMPLTYSISDGIGWGFIAYVLIKVFKGKFKEIHPLLIVVAILFAISFSPLVPR